MNKYKLIFEKTYSNRCVSKRVEHVIDFESDLSRSQITELREFGYNKLLKDYPQFFMDDIHTGKAGWSKPKVKEIIQISGS